MIPGLEFRHPQDLQVTPTYVEKYHARRQRISVWTVNDPATVRAMTFARVDGIIGDDPVIIREMLDNLA